MKKIIIVLLIGLCFMSCAYRTVTCKHYFDNITTSSKKRIYKKASVRMRIPAKYKYWMGFATWQEADFYIYPDSSVIYVTNYEPFNPNADNIQSLNDTVYKFRFQRAMYNRALYDMIGLPDQVPEYDGDLQGRDSIGLYWRDIFKEDTVNIYHGNIYFGYAKVPEDKKTVYDKVIESARFKSKFQTDRLFRRWFMRRPYAYRHKRPRK